MIAPDIPTAVLQFLLLNEEDGEDLDLEKACSLVKIYFVMYSVLFLWQRLSIFYVTLTSIYQYLI